MANPWLVPSERYYYGWYEPVPFGGPGRTDGAIKAEVVERLRRNRHTVHHIIRVDVKQGVVILQGDVDSRLAKRSAGDDCWDTVGVRDVSNQLAVDTASPEGVLTALEVMSPHVVVIDGESTAADAARLMAANGIGDVVVIDEDRHPIGIVTDRDIVVRALTAPAHIDTPVREIMTETLLTVRSGARLDEVVRLMIDGAIRRLPVVDDGHLVGVLTLGDLARHRDPGSVLARISSAPPDR